MNGYRYVLEFLREDGNQAGDAPITVDWDPAIEATWFLGLRRNRLGTGDGTRGTVIEPIWHEQTDRPFVSGFRVTMRRPSGEVFSEDFSTTYFKDLAQTASVRLVEQARLTAGENFTYRTAAYPVIEEAATKKRRFKIEEEPPPLRVGTTRLADLTPTTAEPVHADDIPVVIPRRVLDETVELSQQAGALETGGILVGHLHRDPVADDMFVEVTAQLPARHVQADAQSLTFTAETWTDAQGVLDLRHRQELFVGWWHSHPVHEWCKNCPPDNQRLCRLGRDFLSTHDRQLHRIVFPRAYSIALVVNDTRYQGVTHSLFTWRCGRLESRTFDTPSDKAAPATDMPVPLHSATRRTR